MEFRFLCTSDCPSTKSTPTAIPHFSQLASIAHLNTHLDTHTHPHTLELHAKFQQVGKFPVGGEKSSRITTLII